MPKKKQKTKGKQDREIRNLVSSRRITYLSHFNLRISIALVYVKRYFLHHLFYSFSTSEQSYNIHFYFCCM